MNTASTSKYFEILSHPTRHSILRFIDVNTRYFSEILKGISTDDEIGSSKLNFHLKKMLELDVLVKNNNIYSVSELGFKLLSLVNYFEEFDSMENFNDIEYKIENLDESTPQDTTQIKKLPIIIRPENLSSLISVFEYFEGKNYEYMEENISLLLPEPISVDLQPKTWIHKFSNNLQPLLNNEKTKEWLVDRYLKLGYGTRGLQDYGLMDASISVPPLDSFYKTLIELLTTRGKAGLFAKTGMGKSRIALYISSYWARNFESQILYIQDPHYLNESNFENLQQVLSKNVVTYRKSPKWLIIIEDSHLVDQNQIINLKKLIAGASNKTYSIFVTFTDINILKDTYKSENLYISQIKQLKQDLIPNEFVIALDLDQQWKNLRPYFNEWIKWVAIDVLFEFLPSPDLNREKIDIFQSPWSFVVSLGFLKNSLKNLQVSVSSSNTFPLVLYYFLAQIYVMRGEKTLSLNNLIQIYSKFFNQELKDTFDDNWEGNLIDLLNSWTLPASRMLPPYQYVQNKKKLSRQGLISFYHIEWAHEVCNYLESNNNSKINFDKIFIDLFPILYKVWQFLTQNNMLSSDLFATWLRNCVRFDLSKKGEVILTTLKLNTNQLKKLSTFESSVSDLKDLKPKHFVNWMFIKSVINN